MEIFSAYTAGNRSHRYVHVEDLIDNSPFLRKILKRQRWIFLFTSKLFT